MTLTLAAVYAPIGFMSGTTGRLFTEFAWALAGAVLISGFVALTLSPMMCSRLLTPSAEARHSLQSCRARCLNGLTSGYRSALRATLRARALVLLVGLIFAGSSYFVFTTLKPELSPVEDRGTIISFFIGPEGATINFMEKYARQMEGDPAEGAGGAGVSSSSPAIRSCRRASRSRDWRRGSERERKQQEIVKYARAADEASCPACAPTRRTRRRSARTPARGRCGSPSRRRCRVAELNKMVEARAGRGGEARRRSPIWRRGSSSISPRSRSTVNRDKAADVGAAGGDDRPHAGDDARRPAGHALQAERQAVRRHRPGRRCRPDQSR